MAQFEFQISDANIDDVLPVTDGWLIHLSRTASTPPGHEIVEWDEGRQQFKSGRLVLSVCPGR